MISIIHERHIAKTLDKLKKIEQNYADFIFEQKSEIPVRYMETEEHLYEVPAESEAWQPAYSGMTWGNEWGSAWFKGAFTVPMELDGQDIYIRAETDAVEALFWVNGKPRGIFTHPKEAENRGNHHTLLLTSRANGGETLVLALEGYAGHPCYGTQPYQTYDSNGGYHNRFKRVYRSVQVMLLREDVQNFVFGLRTLNQLAAAAAVDAFRRSRVIEGLLQVYEVVVQSPDEALESEWRPLLAEALKIMNPLLSAKNGDSAPVAGIVGHSHMDTAWLWTRDETIRKCARTYANVLSLMEQYPEYTFVQSSAFHGELMRRHYPSIFEGMKQRIAEGRWEPNGAVWIECDCNLVSGESMVRQFLKGQKYTQKHFGYTSDVFWLPDTFGYSAAIPQIMAGSRVKYFLTTKLSWNDTNVFPYTTFSWRGLDGTSVLSHFNFIHCWPDAGSLIQRIYGAGYNSNGSNINGRPSGSALGRRLVSYGFGDGGGGPQYEMLEMARRTRDVEGAPRAEHTSVSRFMKEVEESDYVPPIHSGELYLEGHRGTLTQMHQIKRNNRKAEFALRTVELAEVVRRLEEGSLAPEAAVHREELYELLLINQFHDILPGTSIPEVHDRAIQEVGDVISDAEALAITLLSETAASPVEAVTVWNTLSWERCGTLVLDKVPVGMVPADSAYSWQWIRDIAGREKLLIGGTSVPAMGAITLRLRNGSGSSGNSPFKLEGQRLETPFAIVTFDEYGYIDSFVDRSSGRKLRRSGTDPLNALLMGEDIPRSWDNWDIDRDIATKLKLQTDLISREVVADGPLQLRIRSHYRIGRHSTLLQDMVFRSDSPQVDFETIIDWKDPHQLLKVGFDVNLLSQSARHEIQFGHVERPTHTNTSIEQGMFEICTHKWSDLSESRFGTALLNDCKYGISVEGSDLRLTLHKGGTHPDPRGDVGMHELVYAFLPHSGFDVKNVVRPAYELNVPPLTIQGASELSFTSLAAIDAEHVIIEAVKPSEEDDAFVLRLYEAERCAVQGAKLKLGMTPKRVSLVNLLEEELEELVPNGTELTLDFRPFEIKTVKIYF
ncbi:glycoside hydrolase family 38 C-terminal domain-containing protein [Paenibacillus sp. RC67]|uniref:alpha-mannosidase n=1 Tax=Paenibacillus sp. RC67 TaxID=3039392 RepID=UPI0024AD8910|nr:glycoside hydrolase family 38 C-terminal domain-containing protein [Paenibacillus sp. RC67]